MPIWEIEERRLRDRDAGYDEGEAQGVEKGFDEAMEAVIAYCDKMHEKGYQNANLFGSYFRRMRAEREAQEDGEENADTE
jgi:hypothetical protein